MRALSSSHRCRVSLVTAETGDGLSRSAQGQALARLAEDDRLQLQVLADTPEGLLAERLQAQWQDARQALQDGRIAAWLWMRADLVVSDFLLADRVREESARADGGCWRDAAGQVAALWMRASLAARLPMSFAAVLQSGLPQPAGALAGLVRAPGQPARRLAASPQPAPLLLVTATREPAQRFYSHTALGQSVLRLRDAGVDVTVSARCGNTLPLGAAHNSAVDERHRGHLVAFVHDDVQLEDWHLAHRLEEALSHYDIVGVAGNRRQLPGQPAWHFAQFVGQWSPAQDLVGCVGHDTTRRTDGGRRVRAISHYGHGHDRVRLIDGVFMAMRGSTWLDSGVRFDPALGFDFYDLDLCRQAQARGLRLGVWPVALTHLSAGGYSADRWRQSYRHYLAKWGEAAPVREA